MTPLGRQHERFDTSDDFDRLGPLTGGRIVRARNDVAAQIGSAIEAGQSYYTLGYGPDPTPAPAAPYRRIRVVCLRPGLTATTRAGYYKADAALNRSSDIVSYDLTTAAESSVPLNGLHITVDRNGGSGTVQPGPWMIHVGVTGLSWQTHDDGSATSSVAVMAVSFGPDNKVLSHVLHGMTVTAKPSANLREASASATLSFPYTPSPKATVLRFVVRDTATGRLGSDDYPLGR